MQLTLFKVLQSLKLDDDTATKVVEALEAHMATKMREATAGLEAQLKAQTWVIGAIGVMLALTNFTVIYLELVGH
ncbi:hypothetical protein ACQVP2_14845 [Methylobacterium aquaticum]|uniref:hypothetical protein n=1 Tax=Methylobacterium aquaticum TaxID=270351 RepID=UPI001931FD8B|nr:hypothetical protein [Methylobacterium aquaticum]QRE78210.1 hypothetical protein F1D61_32860 [Methylobacterium aquaticum]